MKIMLCSLYIAPLFRISPLIQWSALHEKIRLRPQVKMKALSEPMRDYELSRDRNPGGFISAD